MLLELPGELVTGRFAASLGLRASEITLSRMGAPPRFDDVSIGYVGPALTAPLVANLTIQLADLVMNPGVSGVIPGECTFPPSGVAGASIFLQIGFGPGVTSANFRLEGVRRASRGPAPRRLGWRQARARRGRRRSSRQLRPHPLPGRRRRQRP